MGIHHPSTVLLMTRPALLLAVFLTLIGLNAVSAIPVRDIEAIKDLVPEKVVEIAEHAEDEMQAGTETAEKLEAEEDETADVLSKMSPSRKKACKAVVEDAQKHMSAKCLSAMKEAKRIEKVKGEGLKSAMEAMRHACENDVAVQEAATQLMQITQMQKWGTGSSFFDFLLIWAIMS